MKNVNIIRVHEKSSLYGGHKGGNCEYIGDLRGAWQKRGGWGFCQWGGGGVHTPMHTMNLAITLTMILMYQCQCSRH